MVPREHGGWVMLYAPLVAGVIRGGNLRWDLIAVAAAVTAAYFARLPALAVINRGTRPGAATRWLAVCGTIVGLSALWLLWHPRRSALAVIALAGAALFVVHLALTMRREERTAPGELAGIGGLALSAPLGYAGAMGGSAAEAAVLWVLNWLFFGSSVFYVKWRVRRLLAERKGVSSAGASRALIAYHAVGAVVLIALAWSALIPWRAIGAFAPLGLRYLLPLIVGRAPTLTQVGVTEIVLAAAFLAILTAAY